jgi:hypothetical protein
MILKVAQDEHWKKGRGEKSLPTQPHIDHLWTAAKLNTQQINISTPLYRDKHSFSQRDTWYSTQRVTLR